MSILLEERLVHRAITVALMRAHQCDQMARLIPGERKIRWKEEAAEARNVAKELRRALNRASYRPPG